MVAVFLAIITDEARGCSNKEQTSVIVHYVDKLAIICEAFLMFVECTQGTSG